MEISNTLCGDIVNYIKMLINKNEAKASEGEEEDVELVEDVQNNEIAVVPSKTENDCRKNVRVPLPTSSERINRTKKLI